MPEASDLSRDLTVFDADNHLYETEDALTRCLPKEYSGLFRYVELNGRKKVVVRDRLSDFIPNPTFEVVAAPGAHMAFFSGDNPEGKTLRELTGKPIVTPAAFKEPEARLTLMDEQGIDFTLMFPTLASLIEERLLDDPELTQIGIRAYNDWLYDQWTFDYQGRILATPIVNPCIVEGGIAELERSLERGAKAILVRPAPVAGYRTSRSPFLPEFDPFWKVVEESGVLVTLHASDSGYQRYINTWEGNVGGEFTYTNPSPFPYIADGGRTIHDTLASAIGHGTLTRFPGLRIMSVENGGSWVGNFVKQLKVTQKKMPNLFAEDPVEVFRRNVWINPFWEDDLDGLIDLVGVDRVCFGSDFPHAEGLDDPVSFLSELEGRSADDVARIMGGNIMELVPTAVRPR